MTQWLHTQASGYYTSIRTEFQIPKAMYMLNDPWKIETWNPQSKLARMTTHISSLIERPCLIEYGERVIEPDSRNQPWSPTFTCMHMHAHPHIYVPTPHVNMHTCIHIHENRKNNFQNFI